MEQPEAKTAWSRPEATRLTACDSKADVGDVAFVNGVTVISQFDN